MDSKNLDSPSPCPTSISLTCRLERERERKREKEREREREREKKKREVLPQHLFQLAFHPAYVPGHAAFDTVHGGDGAARVVRIDVRSRKRKVAVLDAANRHSMARRVDTGVRRSLVNNE